MRQKKDGLVWVLRYKLPRPIETQRIDALLVQFELGGEVRRNGLAKKTELTAEFQVLVTSHAGLACFSNVISPA